MRQATKAPAKPDTARARLKCIYSGNVVHGVGDVIEVDAAEAERLVQLGVAEILTE